MKGKKRFITLTDQQRQELEQGYKFGDKATFRLRCHMILLSDKGMEVKQIAEVLDSTRQSVSLWFDRFEALGIDGLHTVKGGGRPTIFKMENAAEVARIQEIIAQHPQQLKQAIPQIEAELQRSFSKETLIRFIKKTVGPTSDSGQ